MYWVLYSCSPIAGLPTFACLSIGHLFSPIQTTVIECHERLDKVKLPSYSRPNVAFVNGTVISQPCTNHPTQ